SRRGPCSAHGRIGSRGISFWLRVDGARNTARSTNLGGGRENSNKPTTHCPVPPLASFRRFGTCRFLRQPCGDKIVGDVCRILQATTRHCNSDLLTRKSM